MSCCLCQCVGTFNAFFLTCCVLCTVFCVCVCCQLFVLVAVQCFFYLLFFLFYLLYLLNILFTILGNDDCGVVVVVIIIKVIYKNEIVRSDMRLISLRVTILISSGIQHNNKQHVMEGYPPINLSRI